MKDYLANKESFDELLQILKDYNVFTDAVTATGEKGSELSNEFKEWIMKCSDKAESIKFKGRMLEFYISTLMTFNDKISLELASQMANVVGGRYIEAEKLRKTKEVDSS